MRYLILAHPEDHTAQAVHALLADRYGSSACWLVSSNELLGAPIWQHTVNNKSVETEIHLADGRVINSDVIGCVFNRVRHAYAIQFADKDDQDYATMEWSALLLSWLYSIPCPIVNRVKPIGFGAQIRDRMEWLALAAQSSLPVQGYRFTTDTRHYALPEYEACRRGTQYDENGLALLEPLDTPLPDRRPIHYLERQTGPSLRALVTGRDVYGPPELYPFIDGLLTLGGKIDAELYAVTFGRFDDAWRVSEISTFPNAQSQAEAQAIAALLVQKTEDGP